MLQFRKLIKPEFIRVWDTNLYYYNQIIPIADTQYILIISHYIVWLFSMLILSWWIYIVHSQLARNYLKWNTRQPLCENISYLIAWRYIWSRYQRTLVFLLQNICHLTLLPYFAFYSSKLPNFYQGKYNILTTTQVADLALVWLLISILLLFLQYSFFPYGL